jgi:hypothetical protein
MRGTGRNSAARNKKCQENLNIELDRRVQALVPGSILARRPKRQPKRHKNGHGKAIEVANNKVAVKVV